MELYEVELVVVGVRKDKVGASIDKHPDTFGAHRQIGWFLRHKAWRRGVEDETYQVYAQVLHFKDVVCLAHATYFYRHVLLHGVLYMVLRDLLQCVDKSS